MPSDDLKFDIQEKPSWRSGGRITSNLFKDILIWKESFDRLPQADQVSFQEPFTVCMNIEYVFHLCIAERIGVQTYEATKDVLERVLGFMGGRPGGEKSKEEKETVNIAKAFMKLRSVHQSMQTSGKLSVELVCGLHRELMNELRMDAGSLRNIDAYNRLPDNSIHFYAKPDIAEAKLHSIVHNHNIHMDSYATQSKEWSSQDKFAFLIKCAAWLMFHFLETHPFSDGNGRIGWILANYVLSLVNPFPLHLYQFQDFSKEDRLSHFLEAMNTCRKNPKDGPRDLCAIFVEGVWSVWCKFIKAQELRHISSGIITAVVQKSKVSDIQSHVKDIGVSKHLGISESDAVTRVRDVVDRVNVAGFLPHQYTQIKLEGSTYPSVFVRVFP